jgi:hypothetical protein
LCFNKRPAVVYSTQVLLFMNLRYIASLGAISFALLQTCVAQNFVNLDFERATIAPTLPGHYGPLVADPALAFPGWTMGPGGVTYPNYTLYNNLTLGSVAEVLIGPDFPNAIGYTPLQGNYSALLQFGPSVYGTPSLSQTGRVPAYARSITFLVSGAHNDARVTLGGVNIPLINLDGGRVAGDISAFAGQVEPLTFSTTSYHGNWLYFDDIVFSPTVVPEPSQLWIVVSAVIGFTILRARRPNHDCSIALFPFGPAP